MDTEQLCGFVVGRGAKISPFWKTLSKIQAYQSTVQCYTVHSKNCWVLCSPNIRISFSASLLKSKPLMSNTIHWLVRMKRCLLHIDFPCFTCGFPVSPLLYSPSSFQHFYIFIKFLLLQADFPFRATHLLSLQTDQITVFKFRSLTNDLRFWWYFTCNPSPVFIFSTMHHRSLKSGKSSWTRLAPQWGRQHFNFTNVSQSTRGVVLWILKHWSVRRSTRWHTLMQSSKVRKFKQFLNVNHRIILVGKDLEDHLVQPLT